LLIRFRAAWTSSMSGVVRDSQRSPALAFAAMAANGWLISWAIEAVIAHIVVSRETRASSN
jgi:hypothetical protein